MSRCRRSRIARIKKKDGAGSRDAEPSIRATSTLFWNPDALSQDAGKTGDIFDQLAAADAAKRTPPAAAEAVSQPTSGALEDAARRVPAEIAKVSSDTAAGALHAADMVAQSPVSMPTGQGAFHPGHSEEYQRLVSELDDLRNEQAHNVEGATGPDPREGKILQRLAELEKDPNVKRPLQSAAEAVRDIGGRAKEEFKVDPARDGQILSKLISGASSLVPIIASGPAAPVATAAMMGEQQRQDAEEHGAGEAAQNKAFALGAGVGALSEAVLGIPSILRAAKVYKVPPETLKEFATRAAKTALHSVPKEGGQEALEQFAQNVIAKDIIGYDPGRDRSEGVLESGIYGAIIGAGAGGSLQVATDVDAKKAYEATDEGFAARIRKLKEASEGLAPAEEPEKFDDRSADGAPPARPAGGNTDFSAFPDGKDLPDDEIDPEVQKINETNRQLAEEENQAEADRLAGEKARTDFDKELEELLPEEERATLTDDEKAEWERMKSEHHAELLQDTETQLKGSTYELLEALKKVGYLPAVSVNKEATGEMKRIWEAHPAARMKIFRKNQTKSLDTVREELEGYGFRFETAYDMLSAIEDRVSSKRTSYGTQFSKRAAKSKVQATPEEVNNWWKRVFTAIGPGISKQLKLKLGDPETLVEEGIASREDLTGEEQAAWNARLKTIYLLNRGSKMKIDDADVLDLVHEAGHAWHETLGPESRKALRELFLAERSTVSGPLFGRKKEAAKLPMDPRAASDIDEWFAERVAFANFDWANKRAAAGANDGSIIGRAAAGMRLAWLRLGEAVGGSRSADIVTRKMREFLQKGHAAYEASASKGGATAYTYAGRNAAGFDDAKNEGRTFPGRFDGMERFEIDDSESRADWDGIRDLYAGRDITLPDILPHEKLFEQYPGARGIRVDMVIDPLATGSRIAAEYRPKADLIRLLMPEDRKNVKPEDLRSTLLHEVQHAIQQREGFAKGNNLENAGAMHAKARNTFDFWADVYALSREVHENGATYEDAAKMLREIDFDIDDEKIQAAKDTPLKAVKEKYDSALDELSKFSGGARDAYHRTAGEIEAREVEARRNMPAEERAKNPNKGLEDYHPDEVITRFSKRKTMTPEEEREFRKTLGEPPGAHIKLGPGRLYLGTADILERTKGLEFLGKAIRRHVDRARMYQGKLSAPFRAWEQKYDGAVRKKALEEFEKYQTANEQDRDGADNIRHLASPAGKELMQLWDDAAERMQARNELRGVKVKDEHGWRIIRKVNRYFPRSLKPEIRQMLGRRMSDKEWADLVVEMKKDGLISTEEEAKEYLKSHIETASKFDHLGNIEAARRLPLPAHMYDYSFAAAQRYVSAWAERMAQIEAYGQKTTAKSQDLWDKALEIAGDKETKAYIEAARERAFNLRKSSKIADVMNTLNAIATGTMLGNPVTAGANLASGVGINAATFGVRNTLKGLVELRDLASAINDAHEKGILQDDLMSIVRDSENTTSKTVDVANSTANFLLKWSGYNVTEDFVRGLSYVTARSFLREALKAYDANPTGRAWRQYRAFMVRNGIDPNKVVTEKGEGIETDRFYRNSINAAQGGYRFDQVPIYVETPVGRFLFKFQKYGTQAARHFMINFVKPLIAPGKGNPREIKGALRYAVIMALVGAGITKWRELFGTPDVSATLGEIAKTMKEYDRRGMALLGSKIMKNWLVAGAGGMFGNYFQVFDDALERSKFKSPLNPPGLATAANAGELLFRAAEQGTLTPADINDTLRSQLSIWRTLQSAGASIAEKAGVKTQWSDRENTRQDAAWLRTIAHRFEDEAGGRPNRTSMGRVGKTPDSPTLRKLNEALLSGDKTTAKEAMKEYIDGRKNEAAKEIALQSLKSSVRSKQPIRIGSSTSDGTRGLFLKWAQKRLSPEDVARIQKIDRTYRDTAAAVGLMTESKPVSEKAMEKAEQRLSGR